MKKKVRGNGSSSTIAEDPERISDLLDDYLGRVEADAKRTFSEVDLSNDDDGAAFLIAHDCKDILVSVALLRRCIEEGDAEGAAYHAIQMEMADWRAKINPLVSVFERGDIKPADEEVPPRSKIDYLVSQLVSRLEGPVRGRKKRAEAYKRFRIDSINCGVPIWEERGSKISSGRIARILKAYFEKHVDKYGIRIPTKEKIAEYLNEKHKELYPGVKQSREKPDRETREYIERRIGEILSHD